MILDGHIHIRYEDINGEDFLGKLKEAKIEGGVIISKPPNSFKRSKYIFNTEERLKDLFLITKLHSNLYPFFWIDPLEEDASEQVILANKYGVKGFKIICCEFYPSDERVMNIFRLIAKTGNPILFHSGICWNGEDSSKYNRPVEFESLKSISGLKFMLAHISWPWCDECIALYGKFKNSFVKSLDNPAEMFIDISPGTPLIYREEALTKLFKTGYDINNNVIFGSDYSIEKYSVQKVNYMIEYDNRIYNKLGLDKAVLEKIYSENLKRFIGI